MSKVTFVVNFPEGQTPAVSANMDILGGQLCSVAWSDVTASPWNSIEITPPVLTQLLITTVDGEVGMDSCLSNGHWCRHCDGEIIGWTYPPEPYGGGEG